LARVRLTRSARRDLKLIRNYIAADNPNRATAMIDRILDRCSLLGASPAQGRIREDLDVSFELRSVPVYPYVVFYRTVDNVVQVLRVIDGRAISERRSFPSRAIEPARRAGTSLRNCSLFVAYLAEFGGLDRTAMDEKPLYYQSFIDLADPQICLPSKSFGFDSRRPLQTKKLVITGFFHYLLGQKWTPGGV
jgi:toxin ParE1/3/4